MQKKRTITQEGYRRMAADTGREAEAMEWVEGTADVLE